MKEKIVGTKIGTSRKDLRKRRILWEKSDGHRFARPQKTKNFDYINFFTHRCNNLLHQEKNSMKKPLLIVYLALLAQICLFAQHTGPNPTEKFNADNGYNPVTIRNPVGFGERTATLQFNGWRTPYGYRTGAEIITLVSAPPVGDDLPLDLIFRTGGNNLKNRLRIGNNGFISVNSDDLPAQFTVTQYSDQSPANSTLFLARGGMSQNVKTFRLFTDASNVLNAVIQGNMYVDKGSYFVNNFGANQTLFEAKGGKASSPLLFSLTNDDHNNYLNALLQGNFTLEKGSGKISDGNLLIPAGKIGVGADDLPAQFTVTQYSDQSPANSTLFLARGGISQDAKTFRLFTDASNVLNATMQGNMYVDKGSYFVNNFGANQILFEAKGGKAASPLLFSLANDDSNTYLNALLQGNFTLEKGSGKINDGNLLIPAGKIGVGADDLPAQFTVTQYSDQSPANSTLFLARGGTNQDVKTFRLFTDAANVLNATVQGNMHVDKGGYFVNNFGVNQTLFEAIGGITGSGQKKFKISNSPNGMLQTFLQGSMEVEDGNVIVKNGKVGIGLEPDDLPGDHKLYINGSILCTEVKVELKSNWPDYVFSKEYALMPLDSLQKHIEINGHLPGVPSADQIKQHGLEIGEMQKILLQKIEELSLYIIQQQKEMGVLRQEIKQINVKKNNE